MKRIVGTVAVLIGLGTPAWAGIETGLAAYLRGDYETAAREYRALAENNDPAAQFGLGLLYHFGEGVPQDHAEAARWYRRAAMQGEARAARAGEAFCARVVRCCAVRVGQDWDPPS